MLARPFRAGSLLGACIIFVGTITWLLWTSPSVRPLPAHSTKEDADSSWRFYHPRPKSSYRPPGYNYSRVLVIPRTEKEDVEWISEELPNENVIIYNVDNPEPPYVVPKNKGHEGMVYLTYIIDFYDELPDVVMFFHAHRWAWHNNVLLDLDTAKTIQRLKSERVWRLGYMNSRCGLDPGCPNWLHLDRPDVDYDPIHKPEEKDLKVPLWKEVYPDEPVPPALSQPCCAQFAVSSEAIRAVPKSKYEQIRKWLLDTPLEDANSGRFLEYTWQYIFAGQNELCPVTHSCYCDGYGICMGSDKAIDEWMEIYKETDTADDKVRALRKQKEEGEEVDDKVLEEAITKARELRQKLDRVKAEGYERGKNETARMLEVEQFSHWSTEPHR